MIEVFESMIKAGGSLNSRNGSGDTVLHKGIIEKYISIVIATAAENTECVQILLEAGASPIIKNRFYLSNFL